MFLTKNDFIAARSCQTKLYYKKLGYPSLSDDDPYLEFLADGGYMVETMAKLLFPDGREFGHRVDFAYEDYPGQNGYGISISKPSWVLSFLGERFPSLEVVHFKERAWDNHQDVVVCQKNVDE